MKVILIRHGETNWNRERRLQGQLDIPLNLFGVQQAHTCAKHLSDIKIDKIYSSPLKRAYQCAEIISSKHGISVKTDKNLMEIDLGKWQGMKWSEIKVKYAGFMNEFRKAGDLSTLYGGESFQVTQKRAMEFISEFERESDETVVIVTHGGLIKTVVCDVLGLELEKRSRFDIHNLSLTTMRYTEASGWSITTMNEYSYLDDLFSSGGQI